MQEVDSLGGANREVHPADLTHMPYLEACLKEAMRLYPPGVFTLRQPLTEDFTVKGYTIPKGTWIHVSTPFCRHHSISLSCTGLTCMFFLQANSYGKSASVDMYL